MDASLRPAEAFVCACMRATEAACFRIQKCANNRQLIVAGIKRFLRCTYTARFPCHTYTQNAVYATCIYANTQTVIGIFFVHEDGNMHACLT